MHQFWYLADSCVHTALLIVCSLNRTIIPLVLNRYEAHQSMSIVNKISFELHNKIQQRRIFMVLPECPTFHGACRLVCIYLNETDCPCQSVTLLVIPANFRFPGVHYLLYPKRPTCTNCLELTGRQGAPHPFWWRQTVPSSLHASKTCFHSISTISFL